MSPPPDSLRTLHDRRTSRVFAVAMALSLLAHLALLCWAPPVITPRTETQRASGPPPLTAYLLPDAAKELPPPEPTEPPPATTTAVPMQPVKPPPRARAQPTEQPPPPQIKTPEPVIARPTTPEEPVIAAAPAAPKVAPAPTPASPPPLAQVPQITTPPPAETDLSAYIAARKRLRGEEAGPKDPDQANRGALASTALNQPAPPAIIAEKKRNGYGSFDIRRRGYDYAEYMFKGWNENFRSEGLQLVDVRKGDHSDIDIAVVRSIISIIRRTESGDFTWYSHRLGRALTLSARPRDNAFLEEFILKEFYDDLHRYR